MTSRADIADTIRRGYLQGTGWVLEIDIDRVDLSNIDEVDMILKNIAGFIEDGLRKGMNPFWELKQR